MVKNVSCLSVALTGGRSYRLTCLHAGKRRNEKNQAKWGSHQRRCVLLRPESPTSELLFRPDAVFPLRPWQEKAEHCFVVLPCYFLVSVSLIKSAEMWRHDYWRLQSLHSRGKPRGTVRLSSGDHSSVRKRNDGDCWICSACVLCACWRCHRRRVVKTPAGK